MNPIIAKTFGGLTPQYYFRQLFFGALFGATILYFAHSSAPPTAALSAKFFVSAVVIFSTLLYPYSRFVYEGIVGFLMGNNVFFVNALAMLFVKFVTMALCWSFAIFIAPIGLLYLYIHHIRAERQA